MTQTTGSAEGIAALDDALMTTQAASELLQDQLPRGESTEKGVAYWYQFLVNNRRPDRQAHVAIPYTRWGQRVALYQRADLMRHVELERARQLGHIHLSTRAAQVLKAVGFGEPGGSGTGRKLECRFSPQRDETTELAGSMFVQMVITKPLLVFRLSVDEARTLRGELDEAVRECERATARPRCADKESA